MFALAIVAGGGVTPALAGDVDFNGQGAGAVWQYDTINVRAYGYDAFGDVMKELAPGDERSVSVRLRNNTPDEVEFRLVADSLTGDEAKALESYFPGKTADDSLLDVVEIVVSHGTTRLYEGTLRGLATSGSAAMYSASGVSLGLVSAGYSGLITVELAVPVSLGSEAMNTLCAIKWRFVATQYNDQSNPPNPPNPPETPNTPNPPAAPPSQGPSEGPGTSVASGTTPASTQTSTAGGTPVIDDTPISELPDVDVPTTPSSPSPGADVEIDASPTPASAASGNRAWALMNLVLTICAGLLMVGLLLRYIVARGRDEDEDDAAERDDERYLDMRVARKGLAWLGGIVCVIAAVLLFIFTEDMRLPMEIVNKYTIYYVCAVILELVLFALSLKKRKPVHT
jgi:hypothetical protein